MFRRYSNHCTRKYKRHLISPSLPDVAYSLYASTRGLDGLSACLFFPSPVPPVRLLAGIHQKSRLCLPHMCSGTKPCSGSGNYAATVASLPCGKEFIGQLLYWALIIHRVNVNMRVSSSLLTDEAVLSPMVNDISP